MTKVYITAVQYAQPTRFTEYDTEEIFGEAKKSQTFYPIVPVMEKTAKDEDDVVVVAICVKGKYTEENLKKLEQQVKEFENRKSVKILPLWFEDDWSSDSMEKMYKEIIKAVPDRCDVYECISYGAKPQSYIMAQAMTYVSRFKENVKIKGIYYGYYDFVSEEDQKRNKIYNVSSIYFVNDFIYNMVKDDKTDADKLLKVMLPDE